MKKFFYIVFFSALFCTGCETEDAYYDHFYIPSSFTPDSDGVNDAWRPILINYLVLDKYDIDIYDDDFTHVFHSETFDNYWNGELNGEVLPQGNYLFTIDYSVSEDSAITFQSYSIHGSIELIR